jgi:hypothetical protein
METEAPGGTVKVYPRPIDLENTRRLADYAYTSVVLDLAGLQSSLELYL